MLTVLVFFFHLTTLVETERHLFMYFFEIFYCVFSLLVNWQGILTTADSLHPLDNWEPSYAFPRYICYYLLQQYSS